MHEEIGEAGFHLICRVQQRRSPTFPFDQPIRCSVADDRGNGYIVWPGHGNGQPTGQGADWWMSMTVLPALDPAATLLYVSMESPDPGDVYPHRVGGLLDMQGTTQWLFAVPIGT